LTGLTAIYAGIHLQLARLADCPALAMPEAEAKQFLIAWQNYLRHYSISATQKTVDLITAVGVTLFVYTPRAVALSQRRRRGNQPPPQWQTSAQVFEFTPAPAATAAATETVQ
jgi:hypothetical protein